MKSCLVVFAKDPQTLNVKTRLSAVLSPKQRLDLYKAFVLDTIDTARKSKAEKKILAFASKDGSAYFLRKAAADFDFIRQKGRNLGERMYNTLCFYSQKKYKNFVIIGSDSPALPLDLIEGAFEVLKKRSIVLGPSLDGGYYLIGLRKPYQFVFEGIDWGASSVLKTTIEKARHFKKNPVLLKKWFDVDDAVSLKFLIKKLEELENSVATHTRKALQCINLKKINK